MKAFFFCAAISFVAFDLGACRPNNATAEKRAPSIAAPEVSHDLEELKKLLQIPAEATRCTWALRQVGDGVFGPSDYFLTAYVELPPAGWATLLQDGSSTVGDVGEGMEVELKATEARDVVPAAVLASWPEGDAGRLRAPGRWLPTQLILTRSTFNVGKVARIGDALWIQAFTM